MSDVPPRVHRATGNQKKSLLRVIPTMTFIRFVTGKSSGILSDISSGILSSISSGILSGISSGISSGILPGILSGRWGPAVHTELGRSQVEVQRCTLSWEGPRLRSSGAHCAGQVPVWGPAVHTELGSSQVEVQRCTLSWAARRLRSLRSSERCPLSWEVGKGLGEELARRKWTWKWRQRWWRNWRRRRRRRRQWRTASEEEKNNSDKI